MYRLGLDMGSTTAKAVLLDDNCKLVWSDYARHNADVRSVIENYIAQLTPIVGDAEVSIRVTGSVGIGFCERYGTAFTQEVVAAAEFVKRVHPEAATMIDIGGEDAKIVYFDKGSVTDLRMNGNCAGGTGAFIDQMSILLGVSNNELDALAANSKNLYPIASRCGVFSKTDIQNLMAKNVGKEDIAASIFHAIAVQTVSTLSHGCDIKPKVLLCGGPLTFMHGLRKAMAQRLGLTEQEMIVPEKSNLIPAWGAALSCKECDTIKLSQFTALIKTEGKPITVEQRLPKLFDSEQTYAEWLQNKQKYNIKIVPLTAGIIEVYLGIDSGSTTTKIVAMDTSGNIVYTYYSPNSGNPIKAVSRGLDNFAEECRKTDTKAIIKGSYSTGYGEDLIRSAFNLDGGMIETMAHFTAAKSLNPEVSFILDIGGQDMKAIFADYGVITRIEINEACSSGCGSFIETFAKSLGYTVSDFARKACTAQSPCNLGTRCTVFMNSRVKQVLREGASIDDIAAGLSYSVVKNCLYKVLKLTRTDSLGKHIVVQGGTMRNDSIVRALESLIGKDVARSNIPELMGAYGCALTAADAVHSHSVALDELKKAAEYTSTTIHCHGCENRCEVYKYTFANSNIYYSGNRCEKVFSNRGGDRARGVNISAKKYKLLFDRATAQPSEQSRLTIGIPRCLNMYEEFPFWHALFTECGIATRLSSPSTFDSYERGVHSVMSDNICFPAKLAHSHIYDLVAQGVDRIFFPHVSFEKLENTTCANSYNCPIVSGYADVLSSAIRPAIPIDSPVISFKDTKLLKEQLLTYMATLGIKRLRAVRAIRKASRAQDEYEHAICTLNRTALDYAQSHGRLAIVLAGRPYHTDTLVQHKISDMIAAMDVDVLTEDLVRFKKTTQTESYLVTQWTYINRILATAEWVASQDANVQMVQMTSFGCGPDALLLDEVQRILASHGKALTILKIDDINNIGSLKLRVRSLIGSLRMGGKHTLRTQAFVMPRKFTEQQRSRKIIGPYFTEFISPLAPSFFKLAGYEMESLPPSDELSSETGLKYANNEVCYPATLVVGDLIKALESGRYNPAETAVIISQTGGQCRATNYIALIRKAVVEAGFAEVPVLSLAISDRVKNDQPGFTIPVRKIKEICLAGLLFSDCIAKLYYATAVREKTKGIAAVLRDKYLEAAKPIIEANRPKQMKRLLRQAAREFNANINPDAPQRPLVGIVGEIYLKFNHHAHRYVTDWLMNNGMEIIPPILTNFFLQSLVNAKVNKDFKLVRNSVPSLLLYRIHHIIYRQIRQYNRIASSEFRYFRPFTDIVEDADNASRIISLASQFGEGWLLPGEIVSFAKSGVNNVVSLQPFGCIANHVISKGIERRLKEYYPQLNMLSLDFDSGVSDVNIANRLMLFVGNIK